MSLRKVIAVDSNWCFKKADEEDDAYLPVSQFPTQIHLDLLHHGLIPDPYVGKNENDVQWVGETAWVYKTTFKSPKVGADEKVVLAFEGLDTFANVTLNGWTLKETDNMFVPEIANVTKLLRRDGENELLITFAPAYLRGWKQVEKQPAHKWGCYNGDASRLGVRKAQYHWGWDWGPELLTCGPWRPINLEVFTSCLMDVYSDVVVDDSLKSATVSSHAVVSGPASHVRFSISFEGKTVASETVQITCNHAAACFRVQTPKLWYPIRYGGQPLYTVQASLMHEQAELDVMSKRIGLRKVELVQKPLEDQPGTSFFFRVNGIPIFCGGSNWIPADSFITRISKERYYDWMKLVADGNQFMLRVWGGGIYEEEHLYAACDELGILVWQDFMFACGNYPGDAHFLQSVEREARENVKRLRHHPCIIVWAGNNEDYAYAEAENLDYVREDDDPDNWLKSSFPARYIYEKILPDVCNDLLPPGTYYHPGSPWGGRTCNDSLVGDIHQWNVWHGSQEKYQNLDELVGRFVSEFGMEAFPSRKTINAYLPRGEDDPDAYAQSSTVDFHNKAAGHERRLALYLAENIRYSPDRFDNYIYCTQLIQAECLGSAYRLWKRQWKGPGREYCAGALVWQMNDCWPGTSWSICDYYLRPKLAYYAVKREMAPLSIGMMRRKSTHYKDKHTRVNFDTQVNIEIWGSNLSLDDVTADCVLKTWDVETGLETHSETLATNQVLRANASSEIASFDLTAAQGRGRGHAEDGTVVAAYLYQGDRQIARHVNWPEPLKHLHLQRPEQLKAMLSENGKTVQISAEVPVKGLAIGCLEDGVKFDDNLVDVVPGEVVSIGVQGMTRDTCFNLRYLEPVDS